jgi:hypothetical protein
MSRNLNGVLSASNSQRVSCVPVNVVEGKIARGSSKGYMTERYIGSEAELKKSNSNLQIKLKRQSINFIKK